MSAGAIYRGRVTHARLRPRAHRFVYRVFSCLFDLDRLDELDRSSRWFSRNRFNLFSFHDGDYGAGAPRDIAAHVRKVMASHNLARPARIELLCYPRMLGYAFNPLAVFYCYDDRGALSAVIHEVRNTFGGKHSYLIPVAAAPAGEGGHEIHQEADKLFHVSPFMEMNTRYHFTLSPPGEEVVVRIRQTDAAGPIFHAAFAGAREDVSDAALLKAFAAYPLMTVKVIAGIHYEAVRLMLKGMKLLKGAPDPANPVTLVAQTQETPRQEAA